MMGYSYKFGNIFCCHTTFFPMTAPKKLTQMEKLSTHLSHYVWKVNEDITKLNTFIGLSLTSSNEFYCIGLA